MQEHKISMLGTGLIGMFYTMSLNGGRGRDRVQLVYSRTEERAKAFAEEWGIPAWTTDLTEACTSDDIDTVVIGLPNHIHEECVDLAAGAGKAILCTKPLGRTAAEAKRMMDKVESAGVFGGYLGNL
ncbi:MAG: Gfo/Idh/MocA family oxidoreductase [Caldilineaceae bacterium]|nr:Gfo/Idh/MocA family oxidoreductase [Caldilineaceae bacterium]